MMEEEYVPEGKGPYQFCSSLGHLKRVIVTHSWIGVHFNLSVVNKHFGQSLI